MRAPLGALMAAMVTASLAALVAHAGAPPYPNRPIEFVIPFVTGGPTDTAISHVAKKLSPVP